MRDAPAAMGPRWRTPGSVGAACTTPPVKWPTSTHTSLIGDPLVFVTR